MIAVIFFCLLKIITLVLMARGSRKGTIKIYRTSDRVVNHWLRDARKVTLIVQADKKPDDSSFFYTLIFPSVLYK